MQAMTTYVKLGPLEDALPFWQFFATHARIFADGPSNQGTKFLYAGLIPKYLEVLTEVPAGGKSLLNNIHAVLLECNEDGTCKKG